MREIKFRGKRIDNGEWAFGFYGYARGFVDNGGVEHLYKDGYTTLHYIIDIDGNSQIVQQETVSQFTGLIDKNGAYVYEGDILDCFDRIVKVEWNIQNGTWDSVFIRYTEKELMSNGIFPVEWKFRASVIGNIHEVSE